MKQHLFYFSTPKRGLNEVLSTFRHALVLIPFLLFGTGQMWADECGFWGEGAAGITFTLNGSTDKTPDDLNGTGVSDYTIGTVTTSLTIKSAWAKVWGKDKFNGITLYYRVKEADAASSAAYSSASLSWDNNFGEGENNQFWQNTGINASIDIALAPGNYEIEYYFFADAKNESDKYLSNNSGNYHANFTIPSKNLTVNGAANGNTVSGSVNGITKGTAYDIEATPADGYTFTGWSTSDSHITIANTGSASTTVTFNNYSANATVTASFALESSHTVAVTYICTETSAAVKSAENPKVGEVTTSTFTAGTPTGYSFTSWTVGDGLTITSGSESTNSITVKTKVSGTYTLRANYSEVLTTDWKLIGDNQSGSPFGDNYAYASGKAMSKESGYSTSNDAYKTIDVTKLPGSYYGFKVATAAGSSNSWGYGTGDGSYITFNRSTSGDQMQVYSGDQHELKFVPDALGEYVFRVNYPDNIYVHVTFPTAYTVTYGKGTGGNTVSATYSSTSFNSGTKVQSGKTVRFTQTASSGYNFKEWNTQSDGKGTQLSTSTTYDHTVGATNNVYAIYTPITYTNVTLDKTTGTTDGKYSVTYNATTLSVTTTPAKTGYEPEGYYKTYNSSGSGTWTTLVASPAGALQANTGYTDASSHWTSTSNPTLYTKWQAKTYTVTLDDNGDYTSDGSATATYDSNTLTGITAPQRTGYHVEGYYDDSKLSNKVATDGGALQPSTDHTTSGSLWKTDENTTLYTKWTANTYTVALDANTGTGAGVSVTATYDAAMPDSDTKSDELVLPTKTGYDFTGYWDATSSGTKYYNADLTSAHSWDKTSNTTLYAQWTAHRYTVALDVDEDNYGTIGSATTSTQPYYDAAPTAIASLPTAAQGYHFMGFYSATGGGGVQVINEDGTWISNATGYTDGSGNWVHSSDVTLYAYYKKAEITGLSLAASVVGTAESDSITVTPTIAPTPTGTTVICWEIQYNNGTALDPQPAGRALSGNAYRFKAPTAAGTYKIQAKLHLDDCDGTELDTRLTTFQVASEHTVTILYKSGSATVKASTSVTARPLEWSEGITAGDAPFGYVFNKWVAGDGVTLSEDGETELGSTESTNETIYIKASYDGTLTAQYTKKNIIYFKNTLRWDSVFVNLLDATYWNNTTGSGNKNKTNRNLKMALVPGTEDIFYYEYGNKSTTAYVSFTDSTQTNHEGFAGTVDDPVRVVYPTRPTPIVATADTAYYGFNAGTPMFVPQAEQTPQGWNQSGGKDLAKYYNKGYWRYYDPVLGEEGATGYTLNIYNQTAGNSDRKLLQAISFVPANESGHVFKAVANLEAAHDYGIKFVRDNSMTYTNISGHLNRTGDVEIFGKEDADNWAACYIKTTAAGDYEFIITCNGNGKLCLEATFPAASGDYRLVYNDTTSWSYGQHGSSWFHPSRVISKDAYAQDTVSFFIQKGKEPKIKIQSVSSIDEKSGAVSWSDVSAAWITTYDSVSATGVYNFILEQDKDGVMTIVAVEPYTGNYYIRTDNAGSTKWSNYRSEDHLMTYSEYAENKKGSDYTHYYMKFVNKDTDSGKYKNVKYTIANDYSPCVSDTLGNRPGIDDSHVNSEGVLDCNANIRFMWDIRNNSLKREYLAEGKTDGSRFLVLQGQSTKLLAPNGDALAGESNVSPGNNHGGGANAIQFSDKENWMYEANVQAVPGGRVKLYATYDGGTKYFYGDSDASFEGDHAIDLVSGTGDAQNIRVIYDFKTDRLIAAWVPSDATISTEQVINADIMLVREHQESGKQINLTKTGSLVTDKTVYGVMKFNRWVLNNKSTAEGHAALPFGEQKSQYERFNYFISFPFDVKLGEIFGFGRVGRHWRIYYYDGLGRAQEGFFAERGEDNWRLLDDTECVLHAYEGYLLQLNRNRMADDNEETWPQAEMNEVELYFPAMNKITTIKHDTIMLPALSDDYKCTIDLRQYYEGNPKQAEADRRVKDSYWRCIGVPGFTSYEATASTWTNFNWNANSKDVPYLYEWERDDNSLTVVSSATFTFEPMHAYLVQNGNEIEWKGVAAPQLSSIVARRKVSAAESNYYEFKLEILNGDEPLDQTYVRLTDNEDVTTEFDFGQDLSKELNAHYNIYTQMGYERLAANNLPLDLNMTTVVPVGVTMDADGEYTFSILDGTEGVGVTLIDNFTNERTNLGLTDYTVSLEQGTYDQRFVLEISPVSQTTTGIGNSGAANDKGARKVMIDGILYIVRDGQVFDARGARVE